MCVNALGGEVQYCIPTDILPGERRSEDAYLVVGADRWLLLEGERITECCDVGEYHDYKATPMIGNVMLEAVGEAGSRLIARGTMLHAARFAYIAQVLNFKQQKQPERIYNEEPERCCQKCGRPLVHGTRMCVHCMNKSTVFRRLFQLGGRQMPRIMVGTLFLLAITGVSLISPQIQKVLINESLSPLEGVTPSWSVFIWCVVGIGLCIVASQLLELVRGRVMASVGPRISTDLRGMVYDRMQALSLRFLTSQRAGDIMNRVTRDTDRICNLIQDFFSSLIHQTFILVGVSVLLFVTDWRMALFILIPAPLMAYVQMKLWRVLLHKLFRRQFRMDDKANSFLHDVLSGIRVVKAFGREKAETEKFDTYCHDFAVMSVKSEQTWQMIVPTCNLVIQLSGLAVIFLGCYMILGGELTLGDLVQFNAYAGMIYGPISWIMNLPRRYADAAMSVDRIFTIIDEEPEIINRPDAKKHEIKGNVTFEDVTFGYASYEPVLKHISLEVHQGEMIGLVGHSGAGKSTLINLISRFYDVNEGSIKIDGMDIRQIETENLHSQVGVVLQETFLFTGTIFDNIRYARPDATIEEVIAAAKAANAHDFIVNFPDGYDTWVYENGNNLSGGERQRIAIARAVLVNPRILILDEATSALDIDTETLIQEALGRLVKDRTTFAIAHRLSTLRGADRLVVLDKGEVAEVGSHRELLQKKGIYYNLVMAQRQMANPKLAAVK